MVAIYIPHIKLRNIMTKKIKYFLFITLLIIPSFYVWKKCTSYNFVNRTCKVYKFCVAVDKDGTCIKSIKCNKKKCY